MGIASARSVEVLVPVLLSFQSASRSVEVLVRFPICNGPFFTHSRIFPNLRLTMVADRVTVHVSTLLKGEQMYHLVYQAGIANVFRCDTWPNVSRVFQGDFRGAELIVRVLLMADEHVEVWNCNRAGDIGLCPNLWVQGIADAPFCDAMNPPDGCLV